MKGSATHYKQKERSDVMAFIPHKEIKHESAAGGEEGEKQKQMAACYTSRL